MYCNCYVGVLFGCFWCCSSVWFWSFKIYLHGICRSSVWIVNFRIGGEKNSKNIWIGVKFLLISIIHGANCWERERR